MRNNFLLNTAMISMALVLSACTSSNSSLAGYQIASDLNGLVQDSSAEPALLYVRPDAPELGSYNSFIVDPVRVSYSDPKMADIPVEQLTRIQFYFQNAVITELREAGIEIGTRSQPGRMRLTLTITGIKAPSAAANLSNAVLPVSLSVGEVTVEGQFRNAQADRLDAVVVSRSRGSRVLNSTPWSTWADVESELEQWAKEFTQSVVASRR